MRDMSWWKRTKLDAAFQNGRAASFLFALASLMLILTFLVVIIPSLLVGLQIQLFNSERSRTVPMKSVTFLANLETLFVMIKSNLPALQSEIIALNSSR